MILTNCAACAAPLAHNAPRCQTCKTRYCNRTCQADHWRRGHKQICKEIHRGGNAEQYHADKKYKEAVAVAVKKCAADTKGQTCYICTEAVHWETKEGLVRMCACRGTAGFAHVSCLAEQVRHSVEEAEEKNWSADAFSARWERWYTCGLCKQRHHGVVNCALGWACWKTYLGRSEDDFNRSAAMNILGNSLSAAGNHVDALTIQEAELSRLRRVGADEDHVLAMQGNLALTYYNLGRYAQALRARRDVYSGHLKLQGEEALETLGSANNLAATLKDLTHFQEAKALLRKALPVARRVLGDHPIPPMMGKIYGEVLCRADGATLDDFREAVETLEDTARTARRVLGGAHPTVEGIESCLRNARALLRARDGAPTYDEPD